MLPYILLLLIPLLFQSVLSINNSTLRLTKIKINKQNIFLPLFLIGFTFLLVLRNKYLGRDLHNYESIFTSYGNSKFLDLISEWKEILYKLYCFAFYNWISKDYQLFISTTALISVIPIFFVYVQDKEHGLLKASLFVNMSTFIMYFSGIRQGLAISVGLFAWQALKNKKIISYFILCIVATLTHHTGFMVLFLLPLYKFRFKRKDLWWIIPSISIIFIFNKQIFNFLSLAISSVDDKYGAVAGETGAFMSLVMFALFTIFSFVISDEKKMDEEAFALRNVLAFSMVIQSFAAVNPLAMRMNYYFIILIPIAVAKSLECSKNNMKEIANLAEIVMCVFFTLYFSYGIISTYLSGGHGTLDTIPYVPFWKEVF